MADYGEERFDGGKRGISTVADRLAAKQPPKVREKLFGPREGVPSTEDVQNIAAGGCTTTVPALELPKIRLLEVGKDGMTMDVFLIWAIVPDQPSAPWVVSAWDAESRSENEDGWLADLAEQEELHGARFVRVTRSTVNYDRVVAAFEPTEV